MKKILVGIFASALLFNACSDITELNTDPNNPSKVTTGTLFTGAQKNMMDDIYDVWFSGRQCLVYAQYWCQRNYTEEDRYQIRESTNNSYFNYFYVTMNTLQHIIELNTNPDTKKEAAVIGNNDNQIAAAKILKSWAFLTFVDTWGGIPYSEALREKEGILNPKYDKVEDIYAGIISELTDAANRIVEDEPVVTSGDIIYNGDASKWKKFANSLKCRVALRLSKVDPNWKNYIAEAVASGVFEDNSDNALFKYSKNAPNECNFYKGYFVDGRNDFTVSKPFVDILKGQRDTLNSKSHPWENVVDPRLPIFAGEYTKYVGLAYGVPSNKVKACRAGTPNFYTNPPACLKKDYSVMLMTYPELCFILSEYEGYSEDKMVDGITASLEYWAAIGEVELDPAIKAGYINNVKSSTASLAEKVAVQKYIHLYTYGTEAWAEYRRTGYPAQLLKPNEISFKLSGEDIVFTSLIDTKGDIAAKVKYPTNESTLNASGFNGAIQQVGGTNNSFTKMYWDVRSDANPHPGNL